MKQPKRIFIIGHPGAGKALLAKELADKLGWQFIDADIGLEYRVGQLLPSIIGSEGAKHFHECQHNILNLLVNQENVVVTTDASIVCYDKNRELLSTEFVIYLEVSTPIQLERTIRNIEPLLLNTDLKTFLDNLHSDRDSLFAKIAKLTVNSDDNDVEKHVLMITKTLLGDNTENQPAIKIKLDRKDMVLFHKLHHTPIHLPQHQAICLKLLGQGKSSKEIARDMNISYRTIEGYIANMMEALGCASSKELISLYHDQP